MGDAHCAVSASPPLEPHARRVIPRQSLRDLEAQITELTDHLNAATYHWLTLIAEFDRREGWGGDGAKATLPAEAGALFIEAMETAVKAAPATKIAAERDVSAECSGFITARAHTVDRLSHRRADALARIAESYLKHGDEELSAPERQQIVVHVDVDTLKDSTAGRCGLENGPSLSAETVRRLACDASLVTIIEGAEGEPLSAKR